MKANMGRTEQLIRLVLGLLIVGSNYVNYYVFNNPYCPWANLGWLLVLTGLFRWCAFYRFFKKPAAKK